MAKRQSKKSPTAEPPVAGPAETRTGSDVPDVRVSIHPRPEDRPIRLVVRRGGAPVAMSVEQAEAVIAQMQDAVEECR